ncbi:unnamed protein product [Parnassius apollo]|uniref:(apollo) hypothetical protein n=1 Tax=Parnassius apollo TaxID=110799 RepID=A0A8S3XRY0_PARAO|nr:unnamed protein product [Parnassius apollo]
MLRSSSSAVGLASTVLEAWQHSTVAPTDVDRARAVPRSNFQQLNAYCNCSAANLNATRRDVATSRYDIGGFAITKQTESSFDPIPQKQISQVMAAYNSITEVTVQGELNFVI